MGRPVYLHALALGLLGATAGCGRIGFDPPGPVPGLVDAARPGRDGGAVRDGGDRDDGGGDRDDAGGGDLGDAGAVVPADASVATDAQPCPPTYAPQLGSCYRLAAADRWLAAELACEADGPGAHLVVVGSAAESALVVGAVGPGVRAWIGTSKRQGGIYQNVTGGGVFLRLGTQTEPAEECLSLHADELMYLHSCSDANPYLCEYDGVAADPSTY